MVRMAARSSGGGFLSTPHFVPEKKTVASEYYVGYLANDLFPEAELEMLEGDTWLYVQDGASPHKAKTTTACLDADRPLYARAQEWPPYSPELNPLDEKCDQPAASLWGTAGSFRTISQQMFEPAPKLARSCRI